jgi:hypothetical protein
MTTSVYIPATRYPEFHDYVVENEWEFHKDYDLLTSIRTVKAGHSVLTDVWLIHDPDNVMLVKLRFGGA